MNIHQSLIAELQQEAANTKKILSIVPTEKFTWKPHDKSTTLLELSNHIASMVGWAALVVNSDEMDLANYEALENPTNTKELIQILDDNVAKSISALEKVSDEELINKTWTLRMGDQIYFELPKITAIRIMCFNHTYHHRGQLSVYLRLLDIKIPGMYGPSADEEM